MAIAIPLSFALTSSQYNVVLLIHTLCYPKPPLQQMLIHFSIRSEYTLSQMSINDCINWNDHCQKHLQMERRRIALVFSHAVSRDRDDSTMNAHYHLKRVKKTLITGKRGKRGQSERHNSNARLCFESWVENQTGMSSMNSFLVCENIMLLVLWSTRGKRIFTVDAQRREKKLHQRL